LENAMHGPPTSNKLEMETCTPLLNAGSTIAVGDLTNKTCFIGALRATRGIAGGRCPSC
jgi:hypothetical protein